jgi:hypothetical protein
VAVNQPENLPLPPLGQLGQLAAMLHEAYGSFLNAGFTEAQAMYLVACMACGGPREQQ